MKAIKCLMIAALAAVSFAAFAGSQDAKQSSMKKQKHQMKMKAGTGEKGSQFTDKQINKFAKAQTKIRKIQKKNKNKLNSDDKKKRAQAQKKAKSSMIQAVKDVGLKVATYRDIAKAAQTNPEVRKKVRKKLQEKMN